MLWFSIAVVLVCVCGAAWVTFLLLAKRHRKLHHRETAVHHPSLVVEADSRTPKPDRDDTLPPIQPEESIKKSPSGGEVAPQAGGQLLGETQESTSLEAVSDLSKPQPIAGAEPGDTSHSEVISLVEPSDSSSGEGSVQAQEKESEVPLNQPAAQEAKREIEENTPFAAQAVPQTPGSQAEGRTEESIEQEESATQ